MQVFENVMLNQSISLYSLLTTCLYCSILSDQLLSEHLEPYWAKLCY